MTGTVRDANEAGDIVARGVDAGAASGPRYFVSDPKALARRALTAAFLEARAKAADLAGAADLQLGRALSIRESTFEGSSEGGNPAAPDTVNQVQDDSDTDVKAEPAPTNPGATSVQGRVFVVFEAR